MDTGLEWAEHDARAWLAEEIPNIDQRSVIMALLATIEEIRHPGVFAVGVRVAEELQSLAGQLDREAAACARPGQMLALEGAAAKLRILATNDPLPLPQRPEQED